MSSGKHPFAPGTVQGYRPGWLGTPAQRRELARYLRTLAAIGAAAVLAAVVAGFVVGRG